MPTLPALAHRGETALRDLMARLARRWLGWTPTVLTYPGYGSGGRVRVLGRVLLAPATTHPESRPAGAGWQRLLTLESPRTEVQVEVAGALSRATSDRNGLVDQTVDLRDGVQHQGQVTVTLRVHDRESTAPAHLSSPDAARGVICDLDDTLIVTGMSSPLQAAWRTFVQPTTRRRAVPGMQELLAELTRGPANVPVVYLSNGPWNFVGPLQRFLQRTGFPAGALLLTDWGIQPDRWFRDGRAHKRASLQRLSEDVPRVAWTLVGDTSEHDPALYRAFAERQPERVHAILLCDLAVPPGPARVDWVGAVPVVHGHDGTALCEAVRGLAR